MYNGLHDVDDSVVTEISMDTVKRLRDELINFLVQLVQRTIVLREQEMRSKMHTKAWRLAENRVCSDVTLTSRLY